MPQCPATKALEWLAAIANQARKTHNLKERGYGLGYCHPDETSTREDMGLQAQRQWFHRYDPPKGGKGLDKLVVRDARWYTRHKHRRKFVKGHHRCQMDPLNVDTHRHHRTGSRKRRELEEEPTLSSGLDSSDGGRVQSCSDFCSQLLGAT